MHVPVAIFVISWAVVVCFAIPLLGVPIFPSLAANGGFFLSISDDSLANLLAVLLLLEGMRLLLCCCGYTTIANVCSSGVLSNGHHRSLFNKLVNLLCVSSNRVSGSYFGLLATVTSRKRTCNVHSAGSLIFL